MKHPLGMTLRHGLLFKAKLKVKLTIVAKPSKGVYAYSLSPRRPSPHCWPMRNKPEQVLTNHSLATPCCKACRGLYLPACSHQPGKYRPLQPVAHRVLWLTQFCGHSRQAWLVRAKPQAAERKLSPFIVLNFTTLVILV